MKNILSVSAASLIFLRQTACFQAKRQRQSALHSTAVRSNERMDSLFGPRLDDGEDVVLFSDDVDDTSDNNWGAPPSKSSAAAPAKKKMNRWANLNPSIKARIVKEAQERAIRNKKRREPAAAKKRRLHSQYKEMESQSKREKYVRRDLPVNSKKRTLLKDIEPGTSLSGKVISLTKFGAYIDVGTEADGLLHVSQISRDEFVEHPRNYLAPGDEAEVRVVRVDPTQKKLQLTMLPEEVLDEENVMKNLEMNPDEDDRIQLDEIEVDDELWGEIRRVTDYGAYVEVGSVTRGFLHFMDHPSWEDSVGAHPRDIMSVGDRVRVWVVDVDGMLNRIKLTANRPTGLPGPRREIKWV